MSCVIIGENGFVRASNGTITTFDVPGASHNAFQKTIPEGINAPGDVTGYYQDTSGVNRGFLRTK